MGALLSSGGVLRSGSPVLRGKVPGPAGGAGGPAQAGAVRAGLDLCVKAGPSGGRDDQLPVAAPAISFLPAPSIAGTASCWPGSQDSQAGRYQLRSPSSDIAAGMSTPRTTVASMSTAAAIATPNILNSISDSVAKME